MACTVRGKIGKRMKINILKLEIIVKILSKMKYKILPAKYLKIFYDYVKELLTFYK